MAASITCFKPTLIQASSSSSFSKKPNPDLKKPVSASTWWSPLFGWSSDPDYISNTGSTTDSSQNQSDPVRSEVKSNRSRSRLTPGGFTEEKAKQLRKKTVESYSFHDKMYHSAIASRLASDLSKE